MNPSNRAAFRRPSLRSVLAGLSLLLATDAGAAPFAVTSLAGSGGTYVEHASTTGDDRGGIAVSGSHVFYTGDNSTGRFALSNLSGATGLGVVRDAMFSDLGSGVVYTFMNGGVPLVNTGGQTATQIRALDSNGALTGSTITLSSSISIPSGSGIFSGHGRVTVHNVTRAYTITLPGGVVTDLGAMAAFSRNSCESWAYWGVAEEILGQHYILYVRNSTIERRRIPDGKVWTVATYSNLADMCSFTVSPTQNRWYFHHEGTSQFRGGDETIGFAAATWINSFSDPDGDGVPDEVPDNCPGVANSGQEDVDGDLVGDACDVCFGNGPSDIDSDGRCDGADNCPSVANPNQQDSDGDTIGDVCDPCFGTGPLDTDADNSCDADDNCPLVANFTQSDADGDGAGDACDACFGEGQADMDMDGICDDVDSCPTNADPSQSDCDEDGTGDACDPDLVDADGDGVDDGCDNCPAVANPAQENYEGAGSGDACEDSDGDGLVDADDDCKEIPASLDGDSDGDGIGDACDNCLEVDNADQGDFDDDGVGDVCDNCPDSVNIDQVDCDGDGVGDSCDAQTEDTDGDGIDDGCDACAGAGESDEDADAVCNLADNCPELSNPLQEDSDDDGVGDVCTPIVSISSITEDGGSALEVSATVTSPRGRPLFGSISVWDSSAVSQLSFSWLATGCDPPEDLISFTLNGAILASVDPDPNTSCSCTPNGIQTIVIPLSLVVQNLVPGVNQLGFVKQSDPGGGLVAWVSATITIDGVPQFVGVYDVPGGTEPSYGLTDLCVANYNDGAPVNVQVPTPPVGTLSVVDRWEGRLPCSFDLTALPVGDSLLVITATESLASGGGFDLEPFTLSTETLGLLNDGGSCTDGNACTDGDTCTGGACLPGPALDCDDGDLCTQDSCDAVLGCENAPEPPPVCIEGASASVDIRNGVDAEDDSVSFRVQKGEAFDQSFLGTPTTTTSYGLCVYDRSAGVPSIAARLVLPPNSTWVDKDPKGLAYKDTLGTEDGVQKLQIKTGVDTKTGVQFKARGAMTPMPTPVDAARYFTQDASVDVALIHSGGGCWKASFDAEGTNRNLPTRFQAKAQ